MQACRNLAKHQLNYLADIVRILHYTGLDFNFYDVIVMALDEEVLREQIERARRHIQADREVSMQRGLNFEMSVRNLLESFNDRERVPKIQGLLNECMTFLDDELSVITGPYEDLLSIDDVIDQELILFVTLNITKNTEPGSSTWKDAAPEPAARRRQTLRKRSFRWRCAVCAFLRIAKTVITPLHPHRYVLRVLQACDNRNVPLYLVGETIDADRAYYGHQTGKFVQLVRGIYADKTDDIEATVQRHAVRIAKYLYPRAYLSAASAHLLGPTRDGRLFLSGRRKQRTRIRALEIIQNEAPPHPALGSAVIDDGVGEFRIDVSSPRQRFLEAFRLRSEHASSIDETMKETIAQRLAEEYGTPRLVADAVWALARENEWYREGERAERWLLRTPVEVVQNAAVLNLTVAWHGNSIGNLIHDGFEWRWTSLDIDAPVLVRQTTPGKLPPFIVSLLCSAHFRTRWIILRISWRERSSYQCNAALALLRRWNAFRLATASFISHAFSSAWASFTSCWYFSRFFKINEISTP